MIDLAVVAETRLRDAAVEVLGRLHARRRAASRRRPPASDAPCRRRRISSRRLRETRSICRRDSTPARPRPPRLVGGVSAFSVEPGFASATNIWLDGSRSGSVVAIAHERDARAVGRPGWRRLVGLALRQPIELLRRDVEQIDVAVAAGEQISLHVLLVLVAIDDDRLRRFGAAAVRRAVAGRRVGAPDPDRRPPARAASNRATTRNPAAGL